MGLAKGVRSYVESQSRSGSSAGSFSWEAGGRKSVTSTIIMCRKGFLSGGVRGPEGWAEIRALTAIGVGIGNVKGIGSSV